ncbi:MAG: cobalt transporter, inner rane subunit CbiQ [Firmicutes bacterium]|nr:cobalt transporter, inner rane subunit CbiQ [Bacillota bacterium]
MDYKLPLWMNTAVGKELPEPKLSWNRRNYLDKTVTTIHTVLVEEALAAENSNRKGLLQLIQPHIKFTGILLLIVASAVTKSLWYLAGVNLLVVLLFMLSACSVKAYVIRVWLPVLLFTGISVIPGIISWITPGEALFTIYSGFQCSLWLTLPQELFITKQGVFAAGFVLFRSAASLGLVTLLIKTTRWTEITQVLVRLGFPEIGVTILDLTYRYIYLFLLLLLEYLMGRKSRLVGCESQSSKISWIGSTIADFFRLTRQYSQEIHYAMLSRGYNGCHPVKTKIIVRWFDIVYLVVMLALLLCCWRIS